MGELLEYKCAVLSSTDVDIKGSNYGHRNLAYDGATSAIVREVYDNKRFVEDFIQGRTVSQLLALVVEYLEEVHHLKSGLLAGLRSQYLMNKVTL